MNRASQIVEYVWISAGGKLRSKTRILQRPIHDVKEMPLWNFDGSSTGQAQGRHSDVTLMPARIYPDPFRKQHHIMVLCECYDDHKLSQPNQHNTRRNLRSVVSGKEKHEMLSGIEQEYVFYDTKTKLPLGWKEHQDPGAGPQGPYYCGVGGDRAMGRPLAEEHMNLCMDIGVNIGGINAEVMASQWEFQIGTEEPLLVADDLWIARYVLERITEKYGAYVNYHPKPHHGDWNGSGGHVNFSTKEMRQEGGMKLIEEAIKKLGESHSQDLEFYGEDNHLRLTGKHETASMKTFSWGVGDRGSSIRINKHVAEQGKGYFEDRRPASNLDPYQVLTQIIKTVVK